MRIGITGSSGFIGSHLRRALERLPDIAVTTLSHDENDPNALKSTVATVASEVVLITLRLFEAEFVT
jgi:nucleoside-diphosphate-sugar epimerase